MNGLKIMIVDDHLMVRAGLRQVIGLQPDMTVIAECGSGKEALEALRGSACDVVLLDLSLPDMSGLEVLRSIRSHFEKTAVLVLSGHAESQFGINVLNAGAKGYVSKNAGEAELLRAIRSVGRGQTHVSAELSGALVEKMTGGAIGPLHESLSTREFDIFCKLAAGSSVTEIAQQLFLSVKTVSTYRSRIMEKMSMSNNADLTRYALQHELLSP